MTRFEQRRRRLLTAIAALSLLLTTLCGVAQAKYIQTFTLPEQTVNITAQLGIIELREHEAVKQTDGSYILLDGQEGREEKVVTTNAYILMPGVDVPKDPQVVVTKPNDIPVYVYIKVDTNIPADSGVTYQLAGCWKPVDGYPGVYVYESPVTEDMTIDVLTVPGDSLHEIRVDQDLSLTDDVKLNFTAYMYQTAAGSSPAEVYTSYQNP